MSNRTKMAGLVGAVLLALGLLLRLVADQEGFQLLLFFPTFLVVGVIAAGVRRAFLLSLVLAATVGAITNLVASGNTPSGFSVILAMAIIGVVIPGLLAGGLGAIGGLIGKIVFRKRLRPPLPA